MAQAMNSHRSTGRLAALVTEARRPGLAGQGEISDLGDPRTALGLPGDIIVVELACENAVSIIEAYAFRRPEAAMIVIGDDLSAGVVRALLRFRYSDVVAAFTDADGLAATISELSERISLPRGGDDAGAGSTCWAFAGAVGGAGATTLAIEAAFALAKHEPERSVCLIDLNFACGMATSFLDGHAKLDLRAICEAPERLDATLLRVYAWSHEKGVHVIAAPHDRMADIVANENAVLSLLDVACAAYDRVILDLPRHRLEWTDPVLGAVNEAIVVSELTVPSLHAGADLCRAVDSLRDGGKPARLVLNRMFSKKSHRHSFPIDKAEHAVQRKIDHIVRSDWETARMAVNVGMPMALVKAKSPVVRDIAEMVEQLMAAERGTADVHVVRQARG